MSLLKNPIVMLVSLLFIAFGVGYCVCFYRHYFRQEDTFDLNYSIPSRTVEITIEILFESYQNTSFDNDIGLRESLYPLKDQTELLDIWDKRQYREGYIFAIKKNILEVNTNDFKLMILNNYNSKNTILHDKKYYDNSINSSFYLAGIKNGNERFSKIKEHIWQEVSRVACKYCQTDHANWLDKGEQVPESELSKRLEEMPYFQSVIFLQKKLCNP
jgi:hypothetical protein